MSCGLPDAPGLTFPLPGSPALDLPPIPDQPDLSWGADLGLTIEVASPSFPATSGPSSEVPELPETPDLAWGAELGVSLTTASVALPISGAPAAELPAIPGLENPPCPVDEKV